MKSFSIKLANTLAMSSVVLWIGCTIFVLLFPGLSQQILSAWFHFELVAAEQAMTITLENFLLGGITLVTAGWITGFLVGEIWCSQNTKAQADTQKEVVKSSCCS